MNTYINDGCGGIVNQKFLFKPSQELYSRNSLLKYFKFTKQHRHTQSFKTEQKMTAIPALIAFVVRVLPTFNIVHPGDTAVFECDVVLPQNDAVYNYTWNGHINISRYHNFRFENNDRTLYILDVNVQDNNTDVSCNVNLQSGLIGTKSIGMIVVLPRADTTTTLQRGVFTSSPPTTPTTTNNQNVSLLSHPGFASTPTTPTPAAGTSARSTSQSIHLSTEGLSPGGTPCIAPDCITLPTSKETVTPKKSLKTVPDNTTPSKTRESSWTVHLDSMETSFDIVTHTANPPDSKEVKTSDTSSASGGTYDDDDGYFFMTSIEGIVTIAVGFLVVVTAFIASIQYLRYINMRDRKTSAYINPPVVYNRASETVATAPSTLTSQSEIQSVIVPSSSNKRYTPNLYNPVNKHYKSMSSLSSDSDHPHTDHSGRHSQGSSRMYKTASNYSIISRQSYENLSLASTERNQQELTDSSN